MDDEHAFWSGIVKFVNSFEPSAGWTAVGVILAFVITNIVTIWSIRHGANAERRLSKEVAKRQTLQEELNNFYIPIWTKIHFNRNLFESVRNRTFPDFEAKMSVRERYRLEAQRNEASESWGKIRKEVILPMNKKIKELIESKVKYLNTKDSVAHYLNLHAHIVMYEQFQVFPREIYEDHQFPAEIEEHVKIIIEDIQLQLKEVS